MKLHILSKVKFEFLSTQHSVMMEANAPNRRPLSSVGNKTPSALSKLPQPNSLKENGNLKKPSINVNKNITKTKVIRPPVSSISAKRPKSDNISTDKFSVKKNIRSTFKVPASTRSVPLKRSVSSINVSSSATKAPTKSEAPSAKKPKRAAWDVKGRLQDMELLFQENQSHYADVEARLVESNQRLSVLEQKKIEVEKNLEIENSEKNEMTSIVSKLEESLKKQIESTNEMRRNFMREIDELRFLNENLERKLRCLKDELDNSQNECIGLKGKISEMTTSQAGVQSELNSNKVQLTAAQEDILSKEKWIANLESIVVSKNQMIEEIENKLREEETKRRKLHNTVQELKGNIRVFCRVRPLLENESSDTSLSHLSFPDTDKHTLSLCRLADCNLNESVMSNRNKATPKYDFNFDRVFEPLSTQDEVFEEISQLVQSALDGYNVCVFAYGQTGSGKTFTMEGPADVDINDDKDLGMIPRSVSQIFKTIEQLKSKGWNYSVQASYLEIYNETIRDLLSTNSENLKYEIKMKKSKHNEVYVSNLTTEDVLNPAQVMKLIRKARNSRAVASTKCNERSSRSHSVFQLQLCGDNSTTHESSIGTLNLVDLAGSERLKDSGAEGDRLKETQKINSSLSVLGNVIMSLSNKAEHIPYRNSKLTHLLMNSLGGNSKTLMFVNISPKEDHISESLNSLRFATKVNQCQIGTAHKKVK